MPRTARRKSGECIYHIMIKSVGGTLLFQDEYDKLKYLKYIKQYMETHFFKVYGYCLMDNHGHMIIDAAGADISKIMKGINQSYAQYYNRRHGRGGHLFADRFKSKIVNSDRYLITLSGYIHNNPKDIWGYEKNVEKYPFSSLGIYLGLYKDTLGIVDTDFVMQLFNKEAKKSKVRYIDFVKNCDKEELKRIVEFKDEKTEYRSERKVIERNIKPERVLEMIADGMNMNTADVTVKHVKSARELKAFMAFIMRGFCDMKQREICEYFGNITQSYVSQLCRDGYMLSKENERYKKVFKVFLSSLTG